MAHDWSESATATLGFDILGMENKNYRNNHRNQ
jgi:hypothetical protein